MGDLFVGLLKDSEAEVQGVAAKQVSDVASGLTTDDLIAKVMPCVDTLSTDPSQHVRTSLAGVIMGLGREMGKQLTMKTLLPRCIDLLKDECPEVRLAIISNLDSVNDFIGIEDLSDSLLPAVVELARDRMWRVRLAIIEYMPLLGKQLGSDYFDSYSVSNESLSKLCKSWLRDEVHAVREAAAINLQKLAEVFGAEWVKTTIMPEIKDMQTNQNYLYRLTTLKCCELFSLVLGPEITENELLPSVLSLTADPIPNVRFNVANTLARICSVHGA